MNEALIVYSRQGCHLCEVLLEALRPLVAGRLDIEIRDIDTAADWHERYFMDIPVVTFADREVCRHRLDREAVLALLARLAAEPRE